VGEKVNLLYEKSRTMSGLFTQVLGIQEENHFQYIIRTLKRSRNKLAHPDHQRILEGDIDLSLIPKGYEKYTRLLVKWDPSSCIGVQERQG
jgi:hypothetical protein